MSHEIVEAAREVQRRFDWSPGSNDFHVVDVWVSRTATLTRLRGIGESEREIVLKLFSDWEPDEVRAAHEALTLRCRILSGHGADVAHSVVPLGWLADPPLLCMEYVPGSDVARALKQPEARSSGVLEDAIAACGRALGYLHTATTSGDADSSGSDLRRLATRIGLRNTAHRLATARASPLTVASAGDFAAYNARLDDAGGVTLIDVARRQTRLRPHRDVAWFLYSMRSPANDATPLERVFRTAYSEAGPVDLANPAESFAVDLFLAQRYRGMVASHLRKGSVMRGARTLSALLSHRRDTIVRADASW
jgi:hypothetical protein